METMINFHWNIMMEQMKAITFWFTVVTVAVLTISEIKLT